MREEARAFRRAEQGGVVRDAAARIVDVCPRERAEQADLLRHPVKNPEPGRGVANQRLVQIRIVAVGKLRAHYAAPACAEFAKRLGAYYPLDVVEVKASDGSQPEQAMREEAERILKHVHDDDCVWLLDRTGAELASDELSGRLGQVGNAGTRRLVLVVAGTYGASDALRRRADFVWSLSRLTLLHEWARMLVLEQLYRAAKIARNEPYHH